MITAKQKKLLKQFLTLAPEPELTFTYDELLGYLFGLAMTPDIILPSEWLPVIFGDETPVYNSMEEMEEIMNCLTEIYNGFTDNFHNNALDFPFTEEFLMAGDMATLYEWVSGLDEALALRDELWDPMEFPKISEKKAEELFYSMMVIQGLVDPLEVADFFNAMPENTFKEAFPDVDDDELDREMQIQALLLASLPLSIDTLQKHAKRVEKKRQKGLQNSPVHLVPNRTTKIGRNEPCPCKSGKKYKKCCGAPSDISSASRKKSNIIQGNFPQYGKEQTTAKPAPSTSVFQLKVGLKNAKPPIWRRILVEEQTTLARLHDIIQIAMGWTNTHLHMFIIGNTFFCPPEENDNQDNFESKNEDDFTLGDLEEKIRDGFQYVYDFGDDWMHQITVEKVLPVEDEHYPMVLTGRRTCPPEDIGGIYGYMRALEILDDPEDEEYGELREWFGDGFDPSLFRKPQITKINALLKKLT